MRARWTYCAALIGWLALLASLPVAAQSGLSGLFGASSNNDVLPVEQAFAISRDAIDGNTVQIAIDIAPDYYLYRNSLRFTLDNPDLAIDSIDQPTGRIKDDEFFGRQPVYTQPVVITLNTSTPPAADLTLSVDFQGCADAGVCYPPYRVALGPNGQARDYQINPGGSVLEPNTDAPNTARTSSPPSAGGEAGRLEQLLSSASIPTMLAGFFAAGLLLAFTACLYPMIPILSGLIVGDPHRSGSWRAFGLSLVYVEATAVTYAIAGVIAGMTGAAIQADLQSPWVLGAFAGLFVVLAMGMFGLFEFRLPSALQTRLTQLANQQRGGTVLGVAIMGVLSTLIVGACSGPALIAALVFIGSTGDAALGGLALFTLANGMGLPLLVIGTMAGRWLPRSGPWMTAVRAVFGVGFLAVALWTLERFLPNPLTLGLWGILLIGTAVWLGLFERPQPPLLHRQRLARAVALALSLWGAACIIGAAIGHGTLLQPLSGLSMSQQDRAASKLAFQAIDTPAELNRAMADARAANRPVMIDIYADWCVYCVQLERRTFTDPRVHDAVADALLLRADVTAMDESHRALMQQLNVYLPPAIIFYDAAGNEAREARVVGFVGPDAFSQRARAALSGPNQ